MHVVCVGDCGVDHYLPSGTRVAGGITANFARHARRSFAPDDRLDIVSCVGDDEGATIVLQALQDSGIGLKLVRLPGRTPVQTIEVRDDGEKNFVHYDEGVLRDMRFDADAQALIAAADLLVAPVYLQIVGLFDVLVSLPHRGRTCIDFADFLEHPDFSLLERHIDALDIAFFGLDASSQASIARIADLAKRHDKLFIVTLGAAGSRAFAGAKVYDCGAVPVRSVVDTTGAGDAFAAAFLGRYCHGASIPEAMAAGARSAAMVIEHFGAYRDGR